MSEEYFVPSQPKPKNMGFFTNLISAAVNVTLTPVAIVADVAKVATGNDADTTKKLLESAQDDVAEAGDDLTEGNA